MTSTYSSHTHGPIPLSIEGKRLLETLRAAIQTAIRIGAWGEEVSHARGELAKYMSRLETRRQQEQAQSKEAPPYIDEKGGMETNYTGWLKDQQAQIMRSMLGTPIPWEAKPVGTAVSSATALKLTGMRPTMICVDDPQQETAMTRLKAKAAIAKQKKREAKFRNVGVRFLNGHDLAKVYQYKIRKAAKVHLGQELVVNNHNGIAVVCVVSIDAPLVDGYVLDGLKEITSKVAAL